ncbi:MAG: hypothetical protein AAF438_16960 [Pseudomonadota bacterium]
MGRSEEIKTERRRRRSDSITGRTKRLSVDESQLDRENYEYRFINDQKNRVHSMTVLDDWDVVDSKDARLVGEGERGETIRALLVRKPKQYHKDDQAAKQRQIDEQEKAIKEGNTPSGSGEGQYVPESGIKLG